MKKKNPLKKNKERGARKKVQSVKGLPCRHETNSAETNQKPRCRSEEQLSVQSAHCKCEDGSLNTQSPFKAECSSMPL